ncbi:PAS/PAC sensor-containing diguanylate cyclase/phosphodiesterase [Thauera humireducens]|uniref:putative bifunctional diguanylate cyclase/phosphodiesterase n=1 Tax=Thauera humireducens TaxID=1134435 RepID=UPI002467A770|nr:EAL domain-containing protein [Thauera humireducens]CAH1746329.1 PAS/PAC sensor-containing diguanylate cyclase/phosphodiesterase [Thauera humireducens]
MTDENRRLRATCDIDARKRHEQQVVGLRDELATILHALPDPVFELDMDGRCLSYYARSEDLLATSPSIFLGKTVREVLALDEAESVLQALHEARDTGRSVGRQFKIEGEHGPQWFEMSVAPKPSIADETPRFIVLSRKITARKQAEQVLRERESLLRAVVDNIPAEFWARDLEGRCIMENAATVAHWGSLLGSRIDDARVSPEAHADWLASNQRAYAGETVRKEFASDIDGERRVFQCIVAPIRVGGEIVGICGFNQDITERKRHEEQIHQLAFFDPLTRLPNRRLMLDRLEHALIGSARRHQEGALLLIDLDHFKDLNDTHGHEAGDELLMKVAARLRLCIRQGDTAARLGGDEFVVVLEDIDGVVEGLVQANAIAGKIRDELNRPFHLMRGGGGEAITYHCSASIGITLFGSQDISASELLRRADTAMYQAKAAGRNALCFFDPAMQAAATERAALHADLHRALRDSQFELHYQVQVDETRRPIGAEALLRWRHPARGLIFPGSFIGLAEETGLIVPIGAWVLRTACLQLAAWAARPETAHLRLAVNVSARQFRQAGFTDQLRELIVLTGAPASRLELELTESTLIEDAEAVVERMEELRALGIRFSLDDFGTGYSSLAYLKRLPLSQLKVDQSFVRDVMSDANDATIVETILGLGGSLGLSVIAEGVESEDQFAFLAARGCREHQGYLFGRPMGLRDFEALLAVHHA